jgi:prephenate dehydrogenase
VPAAAKECLGIVGVGLIGGSVGLAARRTGRYGPILGVDRDPAALERAKSLGCIDDAETLPALAKRADVIVFCTPVHQIAAQVLLVAEYCRAKTLLTDAGSTKADIVDAVESKFTKKRLFVGAHPLAGSEKSGPDSARADLFDRRTAILTPTARTQPAAVQRATVFWEAIGCHVAQMPPEKHDKTVAVTSHLAHLTAAALAGLVKPGDGGFVGNGFRDTTRLAAGDPDLWTAIFMQNATHVGNAVGTLQGRLDEFRQALLSGNAPAVRQLLTEAKGVRDDLGS